MTIFLLFSFLISSPEILRVYDGDTLHVKTEGGFELKVRLIGIDCPEVAHPARRGKRAEPGQTGGNEALKKLSELLSLGFEIKPHGLDVYGRTLGELVLKGKRIANLVLVEEGYCEVYHKAGRSKRAKRGGRFDLGPYELAELRAKAGKLRIWGASNYESPAVYRKRVKK